MMNVVQYDQIGQIPSGVDMNIGPFGLVENLTMAHFSFILMEFFTDVFPYVNGRVPTASYKSYNWDICPIFGLYFG